MRFLVEFNISAINFSRYIPYTFPQNSPERDHKVPWDTFDLDDLETYDDMCQRLYLEETMRIGSAYEAYKNRIWEEMKKRNVMTVEHL